MGDKTDGPDNPKAPTRARPRLVPGKRSRTNHLGQTLAQAHTRRAIAAGPQLVVDNDSSGHAGTVQPGSGRPGTLARGRGKSVHGVTAKQEFFAQGVASGLSLAAAYRAAYDASGMADRTVWHHASLLMGHDGVAARVNALVAAREAGELHDAASMRRFVVTQLQQHASSALVPPAVRVRALELLGKTSALFVDRVATTEISADSSPEELSEAIQARLAGLKEA